eukprot:TRINITY_DN2321_c1_g2_i2.p1 TRINITY_DN2321_c1_g2~~TRINITY_DN2321_c1_g2_i2.p1  ORF type:complete len:710 (-),score=125.01 TRINITY_DN2321_c1_g2_i2:185-2224(-)
MPIPLAMRFVTLKNDALALDRTLLHKFWCARNEETNMAIVVEFLEKERERREQERREQERREQERREQERSILSFFEKDPERIAVIGLLTRVPRDHYWEGVMAYACGSPEAASIGLTQAQKSRVLALLPAPEKKQLTTIFDKVPNTIVVASELALVHEDHQVYSFLVKHGILPTPPQRQASGMLENGLSLDWPVKTLRTETCNTILRMVAEQVVVLCRAPPFFGKTALAYTLLPVACLALGVQVRPFSCLDAWKKPATFWTDLAGEVSALRQNTLVVVDEAQWSYEAGDSQCFWDALKSLANNLAMAQEKHFGVVLFAAYGGHFIAKTPMTFQAGNSLSGAGMCFTQNEFIELVQSANHLAASRSAPVLDAAMADVIFKLTGGHVGLTVFTLWQLLHHFKQQAGNVTNMQMNGFLASDEFLNEVKTVRAIPPIFLTVEMNDTEELKLQLAEERKVLLKLLGSPTWKLDTGAELPPPPMKQLIKKGAVVIENSHVCFSSPLVARIYFDYLCRATKVCTILPTTIDNLIREALQHTSRSVLQESLGRSVTHDTPSERTWQMEFYAAVTSLIPKSLCISPDVGRMFGTPGMLDFYINSSLRWGVEVLVNGCGLGSHEFRFEEDGLYHHIPMAEHRIVDFRQQNRAVKGNRGHNTIHIAYDDSFTTFMWYQDGSQQGPFYFAQ